MNNEPAIRQLIVKVAGRCNLDCGYCYMYHGVDQSWRSRPKFMSDAVFDAMLDRAAAYCARRPGHRIGLSLHGGEPLLAGQGRIERLVQRARERLGSALSGIALQTNATLVDDDWALLLARLELSIGVSIDGPVDVHDAARPDLRGRGSHARTVEGLIRLRAAQLNPMALCVIDPEADGAEVYDHLRALGFQRIDLLIPDRTHDQGATPSGQKLARFMLAAADRWLAEDDPDVELRVIHGLLRQLMGGTALTDGFANPRLSYLVVESDGAIEGNDVLKVCAPGMPETGLNVLDDDFDALTPASGMVGRMVHEGVAACATCRSCPEFSVCGGGYLPHRWRSANGFDNPSVWCADIRALLAGLRARCEPVLAEAC